jgi:hypothetical protein
MAGCLSRHAESADAVVVPDLHSSPLLIVNQGSVLLDCTEHDGTGMHAQFDCDSVTVYACGTLGDAVLEYADGAFEQVEGPGGQVGTFAASGKHAGKPVVAAKVARERFEAPAQGCRAPASR